MRKKVMEERFSGSTQKDPITEHAGAGNMVDILNTKDLDVYLKIIAEESVRNAYQHESDSYKLLEADPIFGDEEEGGDEGGDEEEAGGDEGGADALDALAGDEGGDEGGGEEDAAAEEPEAEPEPQKAQIRPAPLDLELGQISSDGLISTLNMIRAGRSFKEAEIATQLRNYFERQLNDSERLALATFLSALHDITSGTPADQAPEPDDENVNIDARDQEQQTQTQRPHDQTPQAQQQQPPQQQQRPAPPTGRGVEDTSPPIQVGPRDRERQRMYEEYRNKIRSILG